MADVVGEALLRLELEDNASGEMAKAVAEFKAEAKALGREEAKIKLDVDTKGLTRGLEKAKAELKAFEAEQKNLTTQLKKQQEVQKTASGNERGWATRRIRDIEAEIAANQRQIDGQKKGIASDQNRLNSLKRVADVHQLVAKQVNLLEKETRKSIAADKDAQKAADALTNSRLNSLKTTQRAIGLERQYEAARKRSLALEKAAGKAQGSEKYRVDIDSRAALAEMARLHEELVIMGRDPIKQRVEMDGSSLSKFKQARNALLFGHTTGPSKSNAFADISTLAKKLADARVNIGPLTTSIGGLALGITALSPVVIGLVGALGSLIGVAGAGLGGVLVTGGALMTGFGMATLGVVSVLKPYANQVMQAISAQKAYNLVVSKYGEGSKQQVKALGILNNQMKSLSPAVRQGAAEFEKFRQAWHAATAPAGKAAIGEIFGSTIKTMKADMGFFAKDTNVALGQVSHAWSAFMAQLRTPAMQGSLNNIFKNFNASIPNIASGLRSLFSALMQVFSTASSFLPGLTKGFASWAKGIDTAAQKSGGFLGGVKSMIGAMRDLGHFAAAAGRWLTALFAPSVKPGGNWVMQMADDMNKAAAKMRTAGGQKGLTDFFSQSISMTKDLVAVLAPLLATIAHLAIAFGPVGTAALKVARYVGDLVASFTKLGVIGPAVSAALAVFVGGRLIGKLLMVGKLFNTLKAGALGVGAAIKAWQLAGTGLSGLKAAFKGMAGSFGKSLGATGALEASMAAGAAEMGTAIEGAATAGAAEMGTALGAAGATSGEAIGAAILAASEAGAAMYAEAISGAAAAAGAEIGGAMTTAGAAAAAEIGTAETVGAAAPAAASVAGSAAAGIGGAAIAADAGVAEGAIAGLAGAEGGAALAGGGLAAALTTAAPIVLGLGAAAVIAYGAFKLFSGGQTQAQKIQSDMNRETAFGAKLLPQLTAGMRGNNLAGQSLATTHLQLAASTKTLGSLSHQLNVLQAQGKTGTEEYRQKLLEFDQQQQQTTQLQQEQGAAIAKQVAEHKKLQAEYGSNTKHTMQTYNAALREQQAAQEGVTKAEKAFGPAQSAEKEAAMKRLAVANKAVADAGDKLTISERRNAEAAQMLYTDNINMARQAKGLPSILSNVMGNFGGTVERTGVAVAQLVSKMRLMGQNKAANFLVNIPNQAQLVQVTKLMDSLRNQKNITKSFGILATSKNAEEAIRRLQALKITDKTMSVKADVASAIGSLARVAAVRLVDKPLKAIANVTQAVGAFNHVQGMKFLTKTMTAIGKVGDALAGISRVNNTAIPDKTFSVIANVGQALSGVLSVVSAINSVHSTTATITTILRTVGSAAPSTGHGALPAKGGFFAGGGTTERWQGLETKDPVLRNKQLRALQLAEYHRPERTRGGRYEKPTYLVGEERRREYVIATNPAYRKDNIDYMHMAANEMGGQFIMAASGWPGGGAPPKKGDTAQGAASKPGKRPPLYKQLGIALPAKDRIGEVGTADIDAAMNTADTRVGSMHTAIGKAKQGIGKDQATINQYAHQKKLTAAEQKSVAKAKRDLNPAIKGTTAYALAQDERKLPTLVTRAQGLHKLDGAAKRYVQQFHNLEAEMALTGGYMDHAGQLLADGKTGQAAMVEGFDWTHGGKATKLSWAGWRSVAEKLQAEHTKQLRAAVEDAKKAVGKNPDATKLGYVLTLEGALGTSLIDAQGLIDDVQPTATDATGGGGGAGSASQPSFDDVIKAIGEGETQSSLNAGYAYWAAKIAGDAPGSEQLAADQAGETVAAQALVDFYKSPKLLLYAQIADAQWHTSDFLTELYNDIAAAEGNLTSASAAANASGPTQLQLADTARAGILQAYGSNVAGVSSAGADSYTGGGLSPNPAGMLLGNSLVNMVNSIGAAASPGSPAGAAPLNTATQSNPAPNVTVVNNFKHMPNDPHSWSQGIAWELGAAI